jgi:hypothetical protein
MLTVEDYPQHDPHRLRASNVLLGTAAAELVAAAGIALWRINLPPSTYAPGPNASCLSGGIGQIIVWIGNRFYGRIAVMLVMAAIVTVFVAVGLGR